jgi:hypothetical protein
VDSLQAGQVIDWIAEYFCYEDGGGLGKTACGEETLYRLEVESVQGSNVNASFRITDISAAKDTTIRNGAARLMKCPGPPLCY